MQARAQKLIPLPFFQEVWARDFEPFRIAGNLYYVGTYDLASYLITTPQGHILINTGLPGSDTIICKHIRALGFKVSDIRILLATHAHFDHVGAMAAMKERTGARLMIEEKDIPVLTDGGNSDFIFGGKGPIFQPVRVDKPLHDKDTIRLGGMKILVLHHPGHTKGACSFLFDVKDSSRSYCVLIANMPTILDEARFPGMPAYPDLQKDYGYTFSSMKNLQFDIFLASHASQFELHRKHKPGDTYNPSAFIDRPLYDSALKDQQRAYEERASSK
jgi:metallo-beta-lactamase class B